MPLRRPCERLGSNSASNQLNRTSAHTRLFTFRALSIGHAKSNTVSGRPRNVLATQSPDLHISLFNCARSLRVRRGSRAIGKHIVFRYRVRVSAIQQPLHSARRLERLSSPSPERSGSTSARQARATKRSAIRFVRFDCGNVSVQRRPSRRPEAPLERVGERTNKKHFNQRTNVIGNREANYNGKQNAFSRLDRRLTHHTSVSAFLSLDCVAITHNYNSIKISE